MSKNHQKQVRHHKPAQKQLLKELLLAGHTVTQASFIQATGNLSARLSPRIKELRDDGFDIHNLTAHKRDENGSNICAKYRLSDTFIHNVAVYGLDNTLRGELLAKEIV